MVEVAQASATAPSGAALGLVGLGQPLDHPGVVLFQRLPLLGRAEQRLDGAEGLDEARVEVERAALKASTARSASRDSSRRALSSEPQPLGPLRIACVELGQHPLQHPAAFPAAGSRGRGRRGSPSPPARWGGSAAPGRQASIASWASLSRSLSGPAAPAPGPPRPWARPPGRRPAPAGTPPRRVPPRPAPSASCTRARRLELVTGVDGQRLVEVVLGPLIVPSQRRCGLADLPVDLHDLEVTVRSSRGGG